jgi:Ni/Co efflux regulator RcnB
MNRGILLSLVLAAALAASCAATHGGNQKSSEDASRRQREAGMKAEAAPPARVRAAQLEERAVRESSGVVASRRSPGLYWTHNDSGDRPFVYAFDAEGKRRGVWRVEGAKAEDWEDIAAGPGPERGRSYLYVGDIGDNGEKRGHVTVYRFPEPEATAADAASTTKEPRATDRADALRLEYPDGAHNAEALAVHPTSGDLYVITKGLQNAGVYRLAGGGAASGTNRLTRVATLRGEGFYGILVTGADISPDGRRVAICDYATGYELRLPDAGAANFDDIWKQPPTVVPLGQRRQGEAVCYRLDGRALLVTSEGSPASFFEITLERQ